MQGVNQHKMNETNKFLVLKTISTKGPVSRIELSRITKLSKMTVTSIVNEFIRQNILYECGTDQTVSGRKPILLDVIPESLLTLGIGVGRDFLYVGIVDLKGNILCSEQTPIFQYTTEDGFLRGLFALCDGILKRHGADAVWGVGISSIGPIDIKNGVILSPPDFGIDDIHIAMALHERYHFPVYIENDMATAALAELYFGKGRNYNDYLYIGVTAGIGGGTVIGQRLYSGRTGFASLIGHTVVEPQGALCGCGQRGCLEAYSSIRAVTQWYREQSNTEIAWLDLISNAENGDALCNQALDRMSRYLTAGIVNAVNLLDPQCVFIGGEAWYCSDGWFAQVNREVNNHIFASDRRLPIPVRRAHSPGNNPLVGTAALVLENNLEYRRLR